MNPPIPAEGARRAQTLSSRWQLEGPTLGALPLSDGRTRFVVWAPSSERVRVQLLGPRSAVEDLEPVGGGYHAAIVTGCGPGSRYRFVLDTGRALADPASRSQPEGVHGPSEVVDLAAYHWSDAAYRARPLGQYVIYELHVGTFSAEGTFDAAIEGLDELEELGVNAVEPMPIAQFPGARNWGYDGVFPFAVQSTYGGPGAFQRFVDACHRRGIAVVLDVVYNHLGPEGAVLPAYGPYLTDRYRTPWGAAINFDGAGSDDVRAYFLQNARQWFVDFHVDALRLDAIHGIVDKTARPFLTDLALNAAALGARLERPCILIAESSDNDPRTVTALAAGGLGMDGQWNDDFHHALHAVLTGERAGYYVDFGRIADLARAMDEGFVYQGQHSAYRGRRHGAPSAMVQPDQLVVFTQNHDQVGNRPAGDRLASRVDADRLALAAAVLVLAPGVPLLFMGEEYGETAPFPYFVDHEDPQILAAVRRGRAKEMATAELGGEAPDPGAEATFAAAVLRRDRRRSGDHARLWRLYQALLAVRRDDPAFSGLERAQVRSQGWGTVVQVVRTHDQGTLAALFNLSHTPAVAMLPELGVGQRGWHKLLDSDDHRTAADHSPLPAQLDRGSSLVLGAWAFCAYRAAELGRWAGELADFPEPVGTPRRQLMKGGS